MNFAVFDTPRPDIDAAEAAQLSFEHFGVTGDASPLAGERDRSFRISSEDGVFVLKVGNAADDPGALEGQSAAVAWAMERDPSLPLAESVPCRDGSRAARHQGHSLAMSRFLVGNPPRGARTSPGLRRQIGRVAARLSRALRGFDHPVLHRAFPWTISQLPELAELIQYVPSTRRDLVSAAFDRLVADVLPELAGYPHQATHGDLNNDNVLVAADDPEQIVAIFDFGDANWGPRVVEVAIAAAYQSFGSNPVLAAGQVVSAFHMECQLEPDEIAMVPSLMVARCLQSLLMSARHVAMSPGDHSYATSDSDAVWEVLAQIEGAGPGAAQHLLAACGFRRGRPSTERTVATRKASLGPSLTLSYANPVHAAEADGMWITDAHGNRLLDAYNNVPHVGHSHPQVVAALTAQARRLTTNTRYLADGVAEYAERLAGLFPDPLSTVLFVNSGSEANDLAYRMAATITGRRGVITTANAYHGSTSFAAAISPEELKTAHREPWTAAIGGVDLLSAPDAAVRIRSDLQAAAADLEANGETPAMVILDTVFSSDGIFDVPAGMLDAAAAWAGSGGCFLVADEVQAGFGRVGERFWGFAADGVVPDIVTLGKPMGNGHPMGAVVTTAEIAGRFSEEAHFFSTFAGSPVAAAVGHAVLDVIEGEEVAVNADEVGTYLRDGIRSLESDRIQAVRGPGLFVGVELGDGELARAVVNGMRERGVLIGSTGVGGTVLKIRPPVVCTPSHADRIVDTLRRSLRAAS